MQKRIQIQLHLHPAKWCTFQPLSWCIIEPLHTSKRVIGGYKMSSGGITGTVVDIRIILGMALKCLASGILIAHTHPSGELSPSKQDLDLTIRLMDAGKLMDIQL